MSMGAAESTADEPAASSSTTSSDPLEELPDISGWRVLNVKVDSPCDGLGLVPYMDLISHVNSSPLSEHESSLLQHIRPHVPVALTLFSLSTLTSRTVTVTPRPWRGDGLLGLMIRHEQLTAASPQDCFHVLSVQPASPAARAGLQAGADYLLGTDRLVFRGWAQLDNWLRHSEGKDSTVFVFNSRAWRVREVRMRVGRHWGGEGSLGADLAQGWVHRLPVLEDPQRREVRMERKSEVRRGKRSESGLQRQDGGQLLLNLCLPTESGGNGSSDDSVPLLTIRIRESGEYSALPAAANSSSSRQPQRSSQHAHDHQHGDSHSHSHGHGHGSHAHSHGPAAVARNGPSSSPASAAVSNDAGLKATAVGAASSFAASGGGPPPSSVPSSSPSLHPTKKTIAPQLPRSRESSPAAQPAVLPPAAAASVAALPPLTSASAQPTAAASPSSFHSPYAPLSAPFPSLAPNTAAFIPAAAVGGSHQ